MLVIDEVSTWVGHVPDVLQGMLDNIARLRAQGLDVIEDSRLPGAPSMRAMTEAR